MEGKVVGGPGSGNHDGSCLSRTQYPIAAFNYPTATPASGARMLVPFTPVAPRVQLKQAT